MMRAPTFFQPILPSTASSLSSASGASMMMPQTIGPIDYSVIRYNDPPFVPHLNLNMLSTQTSYPVLATICDDYAPPCQPHLATVVYPFAYQPTNTPLLPPESIGQTTLAALVVNPPSHAHYEQVQFHSYDLRTMHGADGAKQKI